MRTPVRVCRLEQLEDVALADEDVRDLLLGDRVVDGLFVFEPVLLEQVLRVFDVVMRSELFDGDRLSCVVGDLAQRVTSAVTKLSQSAISLGAQAV